ncbi:adenylylsulfate kinase [Thermosipho japonicus]|uniref:Adenylylsulfate kinase n=1 Tax=Thermosipho japonicus TaxID=90323 RepID=A0A841GFQ3_9BACT|nr:adenylyl-sulfate kinase [Thermosipho japonicus]MBB6062412.1 adenylylsulfate kinase [Thermosipho japonicus]
MNNYIIWLVGKRKTGKSTIAKELNKYFTENSLPSIVLEGRDVFKNVSIKIEERIKILANIVFLFSNLGYIVIVPAVSPKRNIRQMIKKISPVPFFEIFLTCNEKTRKRRIKSSDDFQLYVDEIFEKPLNPDLTIDTSLHKVVECAKIIIDYVNKNIQGD